MVDPPTKSHKNRLGQLGLHPGPRWELTVPPDLVAQFQRRGRAGRDGGRRERKVPQQKLTNSALLDSQILMAGRE